MHCLEPELIEIIHGVEKEFKINKQMKRKKKYANLY